MTGMTQRKDTMEDSAAAGPPPRTRTASALLALVDISRVYKLGATDVTALARINLTIEAGEFVALWGPSGSGKTSLLNLIGLVDTPTSGEVYLDGICTSGMSDDALAALRNRQIGFIFQSFNLLGVLSALENVMLPLQIRGMKSKPAEAAALRRLEEVGLSQQIHQRPDQMSGGQRQRVAIARALVGDPVIVIADEPTANLDSANSEKIIELMRRLNRRDGVTFIFSTHDRRLLKKVDRRIALTDGKLLATEAAFE